MSKFRVEWSNLPECLNLKSVVEEYENVEDKPETYYKAILDFFKIVRQRVGFLEKKMQI